MASDMLILGGSLAGMACAIRLRQMGYSPLVLEKSHFPRKKLCGEFLGPDALRALQSLGLLEEVRALAFGPVEHTHFYNRRGQGLKIHHRWMDESLPYGLALSREVLDTLLAGHARSLGVTVLEGRRAVSLMPNMLKTGAAAQNFQVRVAGAGQGENTTEELLNAQWVIDATGRSGKIAMASTAPKISRPSQPKRVSANTRVGLQCHVRLPQQSLGTDLHMFLFAGGYGGVQPIGEGLVNVCMLVDSQLGKALHQPFSQFIATTIGQNPVALALLQEGQLEGGFCTTADVNLTGEGPSKNSLNLGQAWLRIGDACVTVDPFTGSGMAHALETGQLAAQCIHESVRQGWDYQAMLNRYQRAYAQRFKTRLQWMRYVRPLLENGQAQTCIWPLLPPFLPWFAKRLR